jgi:hypothetical protein
MSAQRGGATEHRNLTLCDRAKPKHSSRASITHWLSPQRAKRDSVASSAKIKLRHLLASAAIGVLGVAVVPAVAQASCTFGVSSYFNGVSSNQAGAHADFTTTFEMNTESLGGPVGQLRNVRVVLPEGFVGDPQATPQCTAAQLTQFDCRPSSQVGVMLTKFSSPAKALGEEPVRFEEQTPIYNMVPTPGHPATLATQITFNTVMIETDVLRDGTYRVVANVKEITTLLPLISTAVTLWGVPADSSHDALRVGPPPGSGLPTPAGSAPAPFMFNTSDCSSGPLETEVTLESWTGEVDNTKATMPPPIGCRLLKASPTLSVAPETTQASSPSGYDVNLGVPQELAPYSLATPNLRDALINFPVGTALSPSAANGLQGCTQAQIGLHNGNPVACPDASKVGSVEIETPLLGTLLKGSLYVAAQNANPFNSLLAMYLTAEGEGVQVKLAGHLFANPITGQLSADFNANPKVPFSELRVKLFGGPGAPLANPADCGTALTTSMLTFYSSPTALEPSSAFKVTGCSPGRFTPSLSAGTTNAKAGAFAPFNLKLSRSDSDQPLRSLQATLPRGLLGRLAAVPYCPESAIAQARARSNPGEGAVELANPSCPAASQVGTVDVGTGAGPQPLFTSAKAYLAGPYKGAPLSLAVIAPAVAGPFDLGTVVVRNALHFNPETAQVTASTDPFPQILQGIPLALRSIALKLDRPAFTLNPTSCAPKQLNASASSTLGLSAALSNPFQVGQCRALGFKPKLALALKGGTKRNDHPALQATLTYPSKGAYANIARAQVTLPHSSFLDQAHIGTVCTRVQFKAHQCPAASVYGSAKAITPLLDQPLEGPVYLRSSSHNLPDLVADLNGQIEVALVGTVDSGKGGGIRNTFEAVPDAPVSKFTLSLLGGKKGLLVNSENLCSPKAKTHAIADFTAQNGLLNNTTPKVANSCGKSAKKSHRGA